MIQKTKIFQHDLLGGRGDGRAGKRPRGDGGGAACGCTSGCGALGRCGVGGLVGGVRPWRCRTNGDVASCPGMTHVADASALARIANAARCVTGRVTRRLQRATWPLKIDVVLAVALAPNTLAISRAVRVRAAQPSRAVLSSPIIVAITRACLWVFGAAAVAFLANGTIGAAKTGITHAKRPLETLALSRARIRAVVLT